MEVKVPGDLAPGLDVGETADDDGALVKPGRSGTHNTAGGITKRVGDDMGDDRTLDGHVIDTLIAAHGSFFLRIDSDSVRPTLCEALGLFGRHAEHDRSRAVADAHTVDAHVDELEEVLARANGT